MTSALSAIAVGGVPRWELWFGNPNKAAVLFAALFILSFYLTSLSRRRAFIAAAWIFAGVFFYALVHTVSRGGIAAGLAGAAVLLAAEWKKRGGIRGIAPFAVIAAAVLCLPAGRALVDRVAESSPSSDGSSANRLLVWRAAPAMAADAPGGWGLGRSGAAYMSWYQPLDRREEYRTLVNSHLTWLVEFGRVGRAAYFAAWIFAFLVAAAFLKRRRDVHPMAQLAAFAVASFFSTVAEEWTLWIIPAASFAPAAAGVGRRNAAKLAVVSAAGGIAAAVLLEVTGRIARPASAARVFRDASADVTLVGEGRPRCWVVCDGAVLGGDTFGRVWRRSCGAPAAGFADSPLAVPEDARYLTVCGGAADGGPAAMKRFRSLEGIAVLSPRQPAEWLETAKADSRVRVHCGEFDSACPAVDAPGLVIVDGAAKYLPDWPERIAGRGKR